LIEKSPTLENVLPPTPSPSFFLHHLFLLVTRD
jgi:hypothetical protein